MRPPTACVVCRTRRRKCEVTAAGAPCAYCTSRKLSCSFAPFPPTDTAWPNQSPTTTPETVTSGLTRCQSITTDLPSQPLCIDLVELYFRYIHDTFHSLFHPPSVMEDVINGTIPRVLLFAMISLSARFSDDPFFAGIDPRIRGRPYAQEAEHLLNMREVSLTTLQAAVLLGAYVITEGEAAAEAVFYSVACRNALLLDLPNMAVTSRVEQEVNRRAWWTLCMIDVWSSRGVRIPRMLTPRSDVPHPMEETVFHRLRPDGVDVPSPSNLQESSASLLTQMIKLNAILFEISTVNELAASTSHLDLRHQEAVDALTAKLEGWYNNLPIGLQDTHANLSRYATMGLGPMFVAVYLGYYHYGQLLYYPYLHEDSYDDTIHARYYADKCKGHSIGLCEILYRAYSTPGCEVYYTMVGHVLVISSTVQLHILLFSTDEVQIRTARSRLERNFEILTRLQTFWPTLDVCFTRFREFHKACQKYKETSFRMDKWMLQFLFEFAKPVGEKDPDDLAELRPWSMQDLGFTPPS
ncbi:Fungal specific transcription factor domain-containing protein [Cladophialophora immunda]|nr:Fungal specific transcription factor domain-containing protein [Cladophialophora immunda]